MEFNVSLKVGREGEVEVSSEERKNTSKICGEQKSTELPLHYQVFGTHNGRNLELNQLHFPQFDKLYL